MSDLESLTSWNIWNSEVMLPKTPLELALQGRVEICLRVSVFGKE